MPKLRKYDTWQNQLNLEKIDIIVCAFFWTALSINFFRKRDCISLVSLMNTSPEPMRRNIALPHYIPAYYKMVN